MNRKRVQMLRDMMAGIPEANIDLRRFYSDGRGKYAEKPARASCETIACMGGFAMIYPPFLEDGIGAYGDCFDGFFKTPFGLFFARMEGETGTDKEIALKRLDALLK